MKRILLFVTCVVAVLILNSCKNKNENVYVVSTIIPLTGPASSVGDNIKMAIDLCVENWNKEGGICGKTIIVQHNDSKGESKQGQIIANKISMTENPNIVISGISGVTLSAQPILEDKEIIHQCIVSTDKIFDNNPKFTIRNYMSTPQICTYFFDLLGNNFNCSEFALVHANTDYGYAFAQYYKELSAKYEKKISSIVEVDQSGLDYKNILLKGNLKTAKIIYVASQFQSLGRIIKQLREIKYEGIIVSDAQLNSSALEIIGEHKKNLFYIDVTKTPAALKVQNEIYAKNNKPVDDVALIAYNGLDMLLKLMAKNNTLSNKDIMESLNSFSSEGILGMSGYINNEIKLNFTLQKIQ